MSVSKWAYDPKYCDGEYCVGDCDLCYKPKIMEDEDEEELLDEYMEREYPTLINNKKAREEIRNTLGFAVFKATRTIEELRADIANTKLGKLVLKINRKVAKHD